MQPNSKAANVNRKILIVDDEPDVARYLATILRVNGFEPMTAGNVDDGLAMARNTKPGLVCLDIMMPQQSGISMYQQLREDEATNHIPVLIISGAEQEEQFDFRNYLPDESVAEPEGYLEKPVDVEQFVAIVKQLTAGSRPKSNRERS